ncbi:putative transposase [Wolbachia endosymbiont of Cylisticus convexus]|nr:putative transposase [Wolbachia endosymbiont of Cylisticus convexus]
MKKSIIRLIKAIQYSCEGIKSAFVSEVAFRQELLLFIVCISTLFVLDVSNLDSVDIQDNRIIIVNHKITDWNKFTEFAKKYGGKTLSEMAKLWSNVSIPTIHRALKKIGLTRKKRHMDTKKGTKKNALNF